MKSLLTHPRLIAVLLAAFVLLAGFYSVVVPLFEVSDELWHYPMVKTLADGHGLPVQNPAAPGPWRQEGSQPPLYYALGALSTFWIDTSDIDQVRRLNPHADNGIITQDGNINMVVHNARAESWPWQGATLAVHLVRFLSVVMSAATVYFTYRLGLEVFPAQPWIALAGAGVVAFTPMFLFISGSVNNDNLANLLATVALWLMAVILRRAEVRQPTLAWSAALGVVLGLGALSKESVLGLFGLAGLTMAYAAWRQKRWQAFWVEGPLIVAAAAAIAGWWYVRNWQLYGDPLGLNAMVAVAGARPQPVPLAQLWGERVGFVWSYWGLFGGVNVPMPLWVYRTLNALAALSIPGVMAVLILKRRREGLAWSHWAPALLTLLWIPLVVVLVVRWTSLTIASQGRLAFPAISAISLWLVAGLSAWQPERWGRITAGGVVTFLAGLAVAAPVAWIVPRYRPPEQIAPLPAGLTYDFAPPGSDQAAMRLLDFAIETAETQPGGAVRLTLTWEVLAPMDRNWSTFVHLQDSARLIAGQRDVYPGLGRMASSDLQPGRRWTERYVIPVHESAYAPETLDVVVGLYDLATWERMQLPDGRDSLTLGQVNLQSRAGEAGVPNPVSINFGGEMELIGYRLDRRQLQPGQELTVTLYWRGLRTMQTNYSVSVAVVGEADRKFGQKDSWPLDGAYPTAAWEPGEVVEDRYTVALAPDTPTDVYDVLLVVYTVDETGAFTNLKRVTPDGRLVDERIVLTRIWVQP